MSINLYLTQFSHCVWIVRIWRGTIRVGRTHLNTACDKGSKDQEHVTVGDLGWRASKGLLGEGVIELRPEGWLQKARWPEGAFHI